MLDIFSPQLMGGLGATRKRAELAERPPADSGRRQGGDRDQPTIRGDRATTVRTSETETPLVIAMPPEEFEELALEGLRLGLERWKETRPCHFSESYLRGLEPAVEQPRGGSDG